MVNFETDEKKQEREIDLATQEITGLFRESEKIVGSLAPPSSESSLSLEERTVRFNIQRSMAKKLHGLSVTFRTSQKVFTQSRLHKK